LATDLSKIAKTIDLKDFGIQKVPKNQRSSVATQVGELLVDEILRKVSTGTSPVEGRCRFKILNKEYAEDEKFGNRTPNLDLEGDMLNALDYRVTGNTKLEVGIFKSSEVPKADGHNNFSGQSKLPERRFIPDDSEAFKKDIQGRIKQLVEANQVPDEPTTPRESDRPLNDVLNRIIEPSIETEITVESLFGNVLDRLFDGQS
jgi:hypothetical protein